MKIRALAMFLRMGSIWSSRRDSLALADSASLSATQSVLQMRSQTTPPVIPIRRILSSTVTTPSETGRILAAP